MPPPFRGRTRFLSIVAALALAAPSLAQEPSHLERLAGICRTDRDVTLGRYAGRVLWTEDGQLSGMLSHEGEDSGDWDGFRPRSLVIARQTPQALGDDLALASRAVLLAQAGDQMFETAVVCIVSPVAPERPDPGATSRG